ncbi:MAG TPA: response regulator [Methylomirabilota bacterium]|jgi:CheY-like chemotaxis protein
MAMSGFNGEAEHDGRAHLLLVDPYGGSREGLGAALRGGSLVVETAEGIAEALAKMQDGEFDVAVIDLDLPPAHGIAENGWDLVRLVRELNAALLLVLIAAECPPDTQAEALRHGAARLLEKPINPRELRRIVQALRPETAPA